MAMYPSTLNMALLYGEEGYSIFPCYTMENEICNCHKDDCPERDRAKHPATEHGLKDATKNTDKIKQFFEGKRRNIAIATGAISGIVVVDVDSYNGGDDVIRELEGILGKLPNSLKILTGGGGFHLYFKHPGKRVKCVTGLGGKGVDIKGDGGYVIAPHSLHKSGKYYRIAGYKSQKANKSVIRGLISQDNLAELPDKWVEFINTWKLKKPENLSDNASSDVIRKGSRNAALTRKGGQMRRLGFEKKSIFAALKYHNESNCNPALDEDEIKKIAISICKYKSTSAQRSDPIPLLPDLPPPSVFPVEALGDTMGPAAMAMNKSIKAPVAMCAQSVLSTATLTVQAYGDVEIDGRVYPLSDYYIAIAETGERKSGCDAVAQVPIEEYEKQLWEKYRTEKTEYDIKLEIFEARKRGLIKKKDVKQTDKQLIEDIGEPPTPPLLPSITVKDATFDGIIQGLIGGQPSMGVYVSEGGTFMDGYSMQNDNRKRTASGLSLLWDNGGFDRVRVNDPNIKLVGRRFSIGIMVQPILAKGFIGDQLLMEQGLLGRFLISWPESTKGFRPYNAINLQKSREMQQYYTAIRSILNTRKPLAKDSRNELEPPSISLSASAKKRWIKFHDYVEKRCGKGKEFEPITGFACKAAEHALRLAGVLTLVDDIECKSISLDKIEAAIKLTKFYIKEALRMTQTFDNPLLLKAESLLNWLWKKEYEFFHLADIIKKGPNQFRSKSKVMPIISTLVDYNWLHKVDGGMKLDGYNRMDVWEVVAKPDDYDK